MKNVLATAIVVMAMVVAPSAFATWGQSNDRCNGVQNCNNTHNNTHNNIHNNIHNNTHNNTTNNVDNSQNATGGTGVGVGIGGDSTARVGDTTARVGDTTARVGDTSSNSHSGVLASGNSFNHVDGGDSSSRATNGDQSQFGLNLSHNDNTSRAVNGDVTGGDQSNTQGDQTNSNTLVIGGSGQGEGEGFGSTLSPEANLTVGDTTLTNTGGAQSIDGNSSSVGDVTNNVTIEGMTDEQARALGQPDIVEVDSRDQSVENQSIDASTQINDNSVYEAPKMSAHSAAPTFASICTSGASGQGRAWGASISVTSDQCANLMQADAFMALGMRDEAIKYVKKAARHVNNKGFLGHIRHVLTLGVM